MNDIFTLRTSNTDKIILIDIEDKEQVLVHNENWYELPKGYLNARSKVHTCKVYLHKIILKTNNRTQVDHIKPEYKFDCRKSNLRICNQSLNNANSIKRQYKNVTSKYKGVGFIKKTGRWRARVTKNFFEVYSGYFTTEKAAALAYNREALKHFGEFARLNIID